MRRKCKLQMQSMTNQTPLSSKRITKMGPRVKDVWVILESDERSSTNPDIKKMPDSSYEDTTLRRIDRAGAIWATLSGHGELKQWRPSHASWEWAKDSITCNFTQCNRTVCVYEDTLCLEYQSCNFGDKGLVQLDSLCFVWWLYW